MGLFGTSLKDVALYKSRGDVGRLCALLTSKKEPLAVAALQALEAMGGPNVCSSLVESALHSPHDAIRRDLARIINEKLAAYRDVLRRVTEEELARPVSLSKLKDLASLLYLLADKSVSASLVQSLDRKLASTQFAFDGSPSVELAVRYGHLVLALGELPLVICEMTDTDPYHKQEFLLGLTDRSIHVHKDTGPCSPGVFVKHSYDLTLGLHLVERIRRLSETERRDVLYYVDTLPVVEITSTRVLPDPNRKQSDAPTLRLSSVSGGAIDHLIGAFDQLKKQQLTKSEALIKCFDERWLPVL
jgi:hypothetical protein